MTREKCFSALTPRSLMYNTCPVTFLPLINNTMSLIDKCLSCIRLLQLSAVSSVHALLFKSMKKAFSRNTLLSVLVEIPDLTLPTPPPMHSEFQTQVFPMPSDSQFEDATPPPSPTPCPWNPEKLCMVWIFLKLPILL